MTVLSKSRRRRAVFVSTVLGLAGLAAWVAASSESGGVDASAPASVSPVAGSLAWAANAGQWTSEARYHARTSSYDVFLTDTEVVFGLYRTVEREGADARPAKGPMPRLEWKHQPAVERSLVSMRLVGTEGPVDVAATAPLPGVANYYLGDDPSAWREGVPTYGQVRYDDAWPAVDVVFRGHEGQLEYDLVVEPGGDPSDVQLAFAGADGLSLDDQGNLLVEVDGATMVQRIPHVYQVLGGERVEHEGRFVLLDDQRVGFWVDGYDPRADLVIDPVVEFATVLGGSVFEQAWGIDVAPDGGFVVTGSTASPDFPGTEPGTYPGDHPDFFEPGTTFGTRYDAEGELVYSTYVGGDNNEVGLDVKVDDAGNAYIGGASSSPDHPVVGGESCADGPDDVPAADDEPLLSDDDQTLVVLSPDGALLHATCLGGEGWEFVRNLAIEPSEGALAMIYAEGGSDSIDYPIVGGFQSELGQGVETLWGRELDGVILAYDPNEGALEYSTYWGGSTFDMFHAIDVRDGVVSAYARHQSTPQASAIHWHHTRHVAAHGGQDGTGFTPEEGRGAWWLGEFGRSDWADPTGYGNLWVQGLSKRFELPEGEAWLDWTMQYDTEPGWDFIYVQVGAADGSWTDLARFDGRSEGLRPFSADLSAWAGQQVAIRFLFISDIAWSDEDGFGGFDSDGALRLDEVTVTGHPTDDFEQGGDGWIPEDLYRHPAIDYRYGAGGDEDGTVVKVDTRVTGPDSLLGAAQIGGSGFDNGLGLVLDDQGNHYVTGITRSPDAPATPGALQTVLEAGINNAHVAKLSADLSTLHYYTFVGGSGHTFPLAISVDGNGRATISGDTLSPDLQVTEGAPWPEPQGSFDGFAVTLDAAGSEAVFGSYFGGEGDEAWGNHAQHDDGTLYLAFQTESADAPTTDGTTLQAHGYPGVTPARSAYLLVVDPD